MKNLDILKSPFFLFNLFLLLCNDLLLKGLFGNVITGKLSDFSGLIVFSLFVSSLKPKSKSVFVCVAIGFLFWKSSLSQGLINLWNETIFYSISRTIDYSDLLALVVLPIAYRYSLSRYTTLKIHPKVIIIISLFSFIATQGIKTWIEFSNPIIFIMQHKGYKNKETILQTIKLHSQDYRINSEKSIFTSDKLILVVEKQLVHYFPSFKDRFEQAKIKKRTYQILKLLLNTSDLRLSPIKNITIDTKLSGIPAKLNFKNSRLHGKQINYSKTGKVQLIAYYKNGIETDEWTYFKKDGRLQKKEFYQAGEKIKTESYIGQTVKTEHIFTRKKKVAFNLAVLNFSVIASIYFIYVIIKRILFVPPSVNFIIEPLEGMIGQLEEGIIAIGVSCILACFSVIVALYIISFNMLGYLDFFFFLRATILFVVIYFLFSIFYFLYLKRPFQEIMPLFLAFVCIFVSYIQLLKSLRFKWWL